MIGWYVHHVGLGHATRAVSVARRLRHPVVGLGSGDAPPGWPGAWVPLARDDSAVAPAVDETARGTLHWVPRHDTGLAHRHARVAAWVAQARPTLLVVDVSVEVALLARLCGVPVVVVALPGEREDRPHALAHDLAEAILAPWPSGTHERGWPRHWVAKTWAVGAIGRFDDLPVERDHPTRPGDGGRRRVLVLWGAGDDGPDAGDLAAAQAATPGWSWSLRRPGSSGDLWADLLAADVVVSHGGQNAVAEVAAARRPAVVVARPRPHDEQVATAAAVERLGIAVGLGCWPAATDWPALLERALARGGDGWARWSTGTGAADAARLVHALADRLTPAGVR